MSIKPAVGSHPRTTTPLRPSPRCWTPNSQPSIHVVAALFRTVCEAIAEFVDEDLNLAKDPHTVPMGDDDTESHHGTIHIDDWGLRLEGHLVPCAADRPSAERDQCRDLAGRAQAARLGDRSSLGSALRRRTLGLVAPQLAL
jgi:hypothetical protein